MKLINQLIIAVLLLVSVGAQAQESWDLQKCIDYALENNIQVKQQQINTNYYDNLSKQARNNRLPGLSGSISQTYNFKNSQNSTGSYQSGDIHQVGASLDASLTLWNGFKLNNTVKQADFSLQARLQDLQKAKDDLMLNIAAAYLEILFADELIQVDKDQIAVTKSQVDRTGKLVKAGSLAKGSLLEIEAQLASEELNLVEAENSQQLAYLNLYQMLELPATESFVVEKPYLPVVRANSSVINSMDVYRKAVQTRPEVKSAEFDLQASQKSVAIAKGQLYPSLALGANYSTYYYNIYEGSLFSQFKEQARPSVGLYLSIPIFGKLQARTDISNANIDVLSRELDVQNTKNVLRKEIETAYTNAVASLKKYMASTKAVESMQEAFRYTEEKFNVGMVNSVEYNQAKNNLTKAQSDLAQAKYEYIFRTKILDFYNGIPIQL
ncbi:TolC family protein [Mangrovibacterium diazotrophicum]|uniref:Outer membrane protein n=1 Tax=Mangrovibacterium diazotrophicum TaxID=1261403 RepID=A0A419WAX8_9BACT|nr:TolC family protein [Mangrovibacterium diazotrophicum]RKD92625.1 outer membrane protein [Mangrovibacterium diazotrophicum]